jgi:hypothetical protein
MLAPPDVRRTYAADMSERTSEGEQRVNDQRPHTREQLPDHSRPGPNEAKLLASDIADRVNASICQQFLGGLDLHDRDAWEVFEGCEVVALCGDR